jgi:uncharacterized repeat protein (TIGR03803 family)
MDLCKYIAKMAFKFYFAIMLATGTSGLAAVTLTTLVSFTGTNGAFLGAAPNGALLQGSDGSFYGTTSAGGTNDNGTIFKVTPSGNLTTLVSFTGTNGAYLGASPEGALIQGNDGNFYGTRAPSSS